MLRRSLLLLVTCLLTLVVLEVALRLTPRSQRRAADEESKFWIPDPDLGWRHQENAQGTFSNGYFKGLVTLGQYGQRENSSEGTYHADYENLLFIGNSTTASFEVDDHETVPALLEQRLRAAGLNYNVINLGVRGYGTDQSVGLALQNLERYPSSRVIYYFTGNDFDDNNTAHRRGREFGKSLYIRRAGARDFEEEFRPVRNWPRGCFAHVQFDEQCNPYVATGHSAMAEHLFRNRSRSYTAKLHLTRTVYRAMWRLWVRSELERVETFRQERARCREYIEDQMRFHLRRLTDRARDHFSVVGFDESESTAVFHRLASDGTIDRFVDLTPAFPDEEGDLVRFLCPKDDHFCEEGNQRIVDHLEKELLPLLRLPTSH